MKAEERILDNESQRSGFTLVELMVVVSIALLLMAWGIPSFSTWKKKHDMEGQMSILYSNLQYARMTAYSRQVVSGVWWGGGTLNSYQIRSDGNNNGQIDDSLGAGGDTQIGATVSLKYPVTPSSNGQTSVSFDGRGFLDPNNPITLSVSSTAGSAVDCVAVTSTRTILGKMNGGTCNPK